jgi:4-alpha-glucanotransferase
MRMHEARVAPAGVTALTDLAEHMGVVPSYVALTGETRMASTEATLAILRALGAPVERPEDAEDVLWDRQQERALQLLDPVTVVWSDRERLLRPRVLRSEVGLRIDCRLEAETGETYEWTQEDGMIALPDALDVGYHSLTVSLSGRRATTTRLFLAPRSAHDPTRRAWGVFLPLYALRTRRTWGTGDLGDLERLAEWTAWMGGSTVGTLPLLASFLSTPFDPSPYAPVSRLFWNELYVDIHRAPELSRSPEARAALDDSETEARLRALRRAALVDYREAYAVKRRVLEALARTFFASPEWRTDDFWRFLADHPEAQGYASFRATCELWARPWQQWPQRMREGDLQEGDYSEDAARCHLYGQYLANRQLGALAGTARARGVELYLDLPLGVHPDGFDAWRYRELFVSGASVGAPPDDFFAMGQDWGFRPLHPERMRQEGHRYFIASVRNSSRYAGVLRLDHVMALHRLYWVPHGAPASEGVYVRYPAEELWAVLCIESRRWNTAIVGEDLGTVPPEVLSALEHHAARRMYVLPFELREEPEPRLEPVPERTVASLDTHDMATFAAWWRDGGEERRQALLRALARVGRPGDAPPEAPPSERARRALAAALGYLAASPARLVLVNLEDLWLEDDPQNVPGTSMEERPNWRRKARYALEMFSEFPEVIAILRDVDRLRRER